jgi:DNA damage-binding protein 1
MTYLNSGVIFVGSHHGDSQIVRITPSADPIIGIQLDVLDTFKNIAPIMDAIFVDAENSGQVSCHFVVAGDGSVTLFRTK